MIETERMRDIANRLLFKTKLRQVNWIPYDQVNNGCALLLDKSYITISYIKPKAEADSIRLSLTSTTNGYDKVLIASIQAYINNYDPEDGPDDQQEYADSIILKELYNEATKVAYKWDVVLDDIDTALSQPGKIGLNEPISGASALLQALTKEPAHAQRR